LFALSILLLSGCLSDNSGIRDNGHWVKLKEGERIDGYTRIGNRIYGGYVDSTFLHKYLKPMRKIDINSFEVCVGSGYVRDKNHVYYPQEIIPIRIRATASKSSYAYNPEA
jgi:hypothetical protein